ncbi:MAG: DUF72 domain-containing protein [Nitrososphaerales archaeon]
MQLYVGCSGWSYSSWDGHFYPKGTESKSYLPYYSKVFDYVEIDSSFYRIPNRSMTIRWATLTPDNFRFTAKFPQVVTHDTRLGGGLEDLKHFFEMMKPLERKLLCLLIQIPPSLTKDEGLPKLESLIHVLWKKYRYAIEVRHKSWFTKEVYKLLSANNICLAWSQLDAIRTPPEVTTDFVYLRFIGDRSIDEKDFGKIQKDRLKEMEVWASRLKMSQKKISLAIVAANNHYAGFGPATANEFRKMVGMQPVVWDEMKQTRLG